MRKKQPSTHEKHNQPATSASAGKAEHGHVFPVQDNSPHQPGGWFAKIFAPPQKFVARVRAVRRAAATQPSTPPADDRYLRLLAEMDNLKKRVVKEKEDLHRFALEDLMKDLLPVLDSFDKGFAVLKNDTALAQSAFATGMQLVAEQLHKILTGHGLQTVSSCGEAFDPRVHQAIRREETADVESEIVAAEFAKGYLLHNRLLRPALVSVQLPLAATKTEEKA